MFFWDDSFFFDDWGPDPYCYRSEKSSCAERRELIATTKFDEVKKELETSLVENTRVVVSLGCRPDSGSPLNILPSVSINHIFEFVYGPVNNNNNNNKSSGGGKQKQDPSSSAAVTINKVRNNKKERGNDDEVDFRDLSLYKAGKKITIPLTKPNLHLTAPCWRDFSRHVRKCAGWDVRRIAATPEQKKKFRETRKGKVYFINAIYTVPGEPVKKTRKRAPSTAAAKNKKKMMKMTNKNKKVD